MKPAEEHEQKETQGGEMNRNVYRTVHDFATATAIVSWPLSAVTWQKQTGAPGKPFSVTLPGRVLLVCGAKNDY